MSIRKKDETTKDETAQGRNYLCPNMSRTDRGKARTT